MAKLLEIDEKELLTIWLADKVDFASDCATSLDDIEFRNKLLKTTEIAGSTVTWFGVRQNPWGFRFAV